MDNIQKIHSSAYVVLMELVKHNLVEGGINYSKLAKVHLDVVNILSQQVENDFGVNYELNKLYPKRAIEATSIVLKNVLERTENQEFIREISNTFRMGLNPIKFFAREYIRDIEDTPEYLKIRPIIRQSALPVVLSAIDEMLSRGVSKTHMLTSLRDTYMIVNGCYYGDEQNHDVINELQGSFDVSVSKCWVYGEVDGTIDSMGAKTGKLAGGVSGALVGAKIGAVAGSVVPVFGTAVGAALGSITGSLYGKAFGEQIGKSDAEAKCCECSKLLLKKQGRNKYQHPEKSVDICGNCYHSFSTNQ
ncbi:glycine zipper domain-containing protein [Pseudoalteromonas prydzensis]|uniref:glycine zipper domain-containing protein n=1 Tax=Pseudoalteromonas prydzensis TaxID=182141 RepID=UPI0024BC7DFE|nr:glycine zipper domain-containing protein [Pseudoalteromonas prydzensis]